MTKREISGLIVFGVFVICLAIYFSWPEARRDREHVGMPTRANEPVAPSVASARYKIERAARQCRENYSPVDPNGGYANCMRNWGVSAADYAAVGEAAQATKQPTDLQAMAKALRYCRQFQANQSLYGDCLANERKLNGW